MLFMRGYFGQGATSSFPGLPDLVFFATSSKKKLHSSISFSLSAGLSQLAIASCVAACAIIAKVLSLINITPFQSEISSGGTFYNIPAQQMTRLGGTLSISSDNFFLSLSARVLAAAIWAKIKPASYLFKRIKFFVIFGAIGTICNSVCFFKSSVSVPFAVVFKSQFVKFLLAFNFYFFGVFVGKMILNQISNNGDRQCYC